MRAFLCFFDSTTLQKRPRLFQLSVQRVLSQAWGFQKRFGKRFPQKSTVAYFRILYLGVGANRSKYSSWGMWNNFFFKKDSNTKGIETRIRPPKFRPLKIQMFFLGMVNHSWLFRCHDCYLRIFRMLYLGVPLFVGLNGRKTGWWFEPPWKILVSWDDCSQYMGK